MMRNCSRTESIALILMMLLAAAMFAAAVSAESAAPTPEPRLAFHTAQPSSTTTASVTSTATLTATCEVTCTATLTPTSTTVPTEETIPATRPTSDQTIPPPTVTLTPSVTPTKTPAPQLLPLLFRMRHPLENGDFEAGSLQPGWEDSGSLPVSMVTERTHGGAYAVLLGDPSYDIWGGCPVGEAAIEQFVRVPTQGSPQLRLWYRVVTFDTVQFDHFAVEIKRWPGGEPDLPLRAGALTWTAGAMQDLLWQEAIISLDNYRGELVRIRLYNALTNADGYYNTWTYVDDVAIRTLP